MFSCEICDIFKNTYIQKNLNDCFWFSEPKVSFFFFVWQILSASISTEYKVGIFFKYNKLFGSNAVIPMNLLNCTPCAPSRLRALPIIYTRLTSLRAYAPYPSLIRACAPLLTNKRLTRLFLSCVVVSIVRYGLRLKNPRKATGPDFIHLKVIKFASNVIDSHLYNIIIKDLEKTSTQKSQKQH